MPASARRISRTDSAAAGRGGCPAGPGRTSARRSPGADSVPMIGTARVCGTAAGIAPRLIHSTTPSCSTSSTTAAANSRQRKSGSAPVRTSRSCSSIRRVRERQLGPGQLGQPAVDDVEGRSAGPVVEQEVGVERGHVGPAVGQELGRRRRRRTAVDPAVEGGQDRRRHEVRRIGRGGRGSPLKDRRGSRPRLSGSGPLTSGSSSGRVSTWPPLDPPEAESLVQRPAPRSGSRRRPRAWPCRDRARAAPRRRWR